MLDAGLLHVTDEPIEVRGDDSWSPLAAQGVRAAETHERNGGAAMLRFPGGLLEVGADISRHQHCGAGPHRVHHVCIRDRPRAQ